MREIKFRAWDLEENKFLTQEEMTETGGYYYCYGVDQPEDEYILMQYTGLKDKNGVEIYEGDIVEYGDEKIKKTVKYLSGYCCYNISLQYIIPFLDGLENKKPCVEIIGNIYENPELLEIK